MGAELFSEFLRMVADGAEAGLSAAALARLCAVSREARDRLRGGHTRCWVSIRMLHHASNAPSPLWGATRARFEGGLPASYARHSPFAHLATTGALVVRRGDALPVPRCSYASVHVTGLRPSRGLMPSAGQAWPTTYEFAKNLDELVAGASTRAVAFNSESDECSLHIATILGRAARIDLAAACATHKEAAEVEQVLRDPRVHVGTFWVHDDSLGYARQAPSRMEALRDVARIAAAVRAAHPRVGAVVRIRPRRLAELTEGVEPGDVGDLSPLC